MLDRSVAATRAVSLECHQSYVHEDDGRGAESNIPLEAMLSGSVSEIEVYRVGTPRNRWRERECEREHSGWTEERN
jgi:hypothetical protein